MSRKVCVKCGKRKYRKSFAKHKSRKNGFDSRCKRCVAKESKIRYKLRKVAPDKPLICPICCRQPENFTVPYKWHLDHDPETKKFRGWLCEDCNRSMGVLGDTVEAMVRALNYLLSARNS